MIERIRLQLSRFLCRLSLRLMPSGNSVAWGVMFDNELAALERRRKGQ